MKKGRKNDTGKTKYDWQGDQKKKNNDGARPYGSSNVTKAVQLKK